MLDLWSARLAVGTPGGGGAMDEMALGEGVACVMAEMRFGLGLGNPGPLVGCHSTGPRTKACLQALTFYSSAYERLMSRTRCSTADMQSSLRR